MFEEIALSISTALFFLCTLVVSSVLPQDMTVSSEPIPSICETAVEETATTAKGADSFSIVGSWNNGGRTFDFCDNGKLVFDSHNARWRLDGDRVTVSAEIDGSERTYSLRLEVIEPGIMKLGGVTFFKTK